ncbi:MAG: ImmA/IrrE family metallo-endopeptidase [Paraprevotella sp.]|nr:ImmA/IrrE family metallo-endopeptidase [Paraprevotella sp.]
MKEKINTIKIGTDYENRVFKLFSSFLQEDELSFVSQKYSRIFQHKSYKCVGLDRTIDFDITIETYNPYSKENEWSSLVIVECKCLTHNVDISDLDEFETKMNKVSSSGIKGIMVTTRGFTKKSIEQAQKAHIALMVLSEEQYNWIVTRDINKPEHQMQVLLGNEKSGLVPTAYSNGLFVPLYECLDNMGISITEQNIVNIPWLDKKHIKEKANELYQRCGISSNDIAGEVLEQQYPEFSIEFADFPQGVLGSIAYSKKVINISNEIQTDVHRRNFTLAHELGHLYLHQSFLESFNSELLDYDEKGVLSLPDEIIKRMEIQANYFASYLLIPQEIFKNEVVRLFNIYSISKGRLYLDSQPCNKCAVLAILGTLSTKFNVSKEAIKIRLKNEGLLIIDDREPQRINQIITNY